MLRVTLYLFVQVPAFAGMTRFACFLWATLIIDGAGGRFEILFERVEGMVVNCLNPRKPDQVRLVDSRKPDQVRLVDSLRMTVLGSVPLAIH